MMDQNNTVYPTHSCFDDALEFINYVALEYRDEDTSMISLVHGIVRGDDGNNYAHGWVEDSSTRLAIFAGVLKGEKIYFYTPIEEFYTKNRVKETTKYTIKEAIENNIRTIHFGPWEPKYVALCGGGGYHTVIGGGEMRLGTIGKLPTKEAIK